MNCGSLANYKPIEFTFQVPFRELDNKQGRITFERFIGDIPERLRILLNSIPSDDPNVAERLDYSPESLIPLGEWFSKHVHVRSQEKREIGKERKKLKGSRLEQYARLRRIVGDRTLAPETISLCFDVGIYLVNVFQKKFETVQWAYFTGQRNVADVGEPILTGFTLRMNPRGLVQVFAHHIADGKVGAEGLRKIYDIWLEKVQPRMCSVLKSYRILAFPFAEPYKELPQEVVRTYTKEDDEWQRKRRLYLFEGIIGERLAALKEVMLANDARAAKSLDFTEQSLLPLGGWLSNHVHRRGKPGDEIGREEERISNILAAKFTPAYPTDFTMTAESVSLCFDVGLYLARVFQKQHRRIRWDFGDLSRPYLHGFKTPRSSFDLVLAFAKAVREKGAGSEELERLYATWGNDIERK